MSYRVNITDPANEDLRAIFEYIAFELQSAENAAGQSERLKKEILSLDDMPYRYKPYEVEPWFSRGVRRMTVDHYCVFYLPFEDRQTVEILRVIYGGRDIDRIMLEYAEKFPDGKE